MKAMIFAAGLGTRLRPLTDSLPKALVPVCGEPLLYHVIGKLREAGYREIVVNIHHFPKQIRNYLQSRDWGVKIEISDESAGLLETGGAVARAKEYILPTDEPFLVHNVDIISDLDLSWVRSQTRPDALATLVVSPRKTRRNLLFDNDMRLVGWMDSQSGEVRTPYPHLDPDRCRHYAFAGIHNLSGPLPHHGLLFEDLCCGTHLRTRSRESQPCGCGQDRYPFRGPATVQQNIKTIKTSSS